MMLRAPTAVPLFGGPKRRKQLQKQQQEKAREDQLRQQALMEAEFATKAETADFLTYYLERSPFKEQSDQISIAWENLPSLGELESYGELDSTEGTQACRRLFKAVVIWDDLGHDLWETLSSNADRAAAEADQGSLHEIDEEPDYYNSSRSRSRASSRASADTWFSGRSRQTSAERRPSVAEQPARRVNPTRRSTAPHPIICDYYDSPGRYRLPKIMTGSCSNVARRATGSTSD